MSPASEGGRTDRFRKLGESVLRYLTSQTKPTTTITTSPTTTPPCKFHTAFSLNIRCNSCEPMCYMICCQPSQPPKWGGTTGKLSCILGIPHMGARPWFLEMDAIGSSAWWDPIGWPVHHIHTSNPSIPTGTSPMHEGKERLGKSKQQQCNNYKQQKNKSERPFKDRVSRPYYAKKGLLSIIFHGRAAAGSTASTAQKRKKGRLNRPSLSLSMPPRGRGGEGCIERKIPQIRRAEKATRRLSCHES